MFDIIGLKIALSLIVFAIVMALFEVETEGSIPWAAIFPCLRRKSSPEAKEQTSYHILLGMMLLTAFEIGSVLVTGEWISLRGLVQLSAWMLLAINLEDYLWNVINPSGLYGWRKTFLERRYPTKRFIGPIPLDYFQMEIGSLLLVLLSGIPVGRWLLIVCLAILAAIIFTIVMPSVHARYPGWGQRYRKHNRKHVHFFGKEVTATIQVNFSDEREGYTEQVAGISTVGRIQAKSLEELKNI
jgi:hypothetical protein